MARSRNIKPGLFKNDLLGECDPMTRLLFIGLWTLADCDGKVEDRPRRIAIELFPYDSAPEMERALCALFQHGFIDRYTVDNVSVIQVVNFKKHQNPHKNEKPSGLPDKPETPENKGSQELSGNGASTHEKDGAVPERSGLLPITDSLLPITDSPIRNPSYRPETEGPASQIPETKKLPKRKVFNPPPWMPKNKWQDYLASRRSKKRPMNPEALELCMNAIDKTVMAGYSLDDIMEAMTIAGWQTCTPAYMEGWMKSQGMPAAGKQDENARLAEKMAIEMGEGALQ